MGREGRVLAELKMKKTEASKGCLYIRTLEDIDLPTLRALIRSSVTELKKQV
jgi:hypothetical protein